MVIKSNKKGAVEMSLNLIIMLVIGLTVMGLIIAFVTSFLGGAENKFSGKLTDDDTSKIEQVEKKSGSFTFLEKNVRISQGSDAPGKIYVKIRALEDDIELVGALKLETNPSVVITAGKVSSTEVGGDTQSQFEVIPQPIDLAAGESKGYMFEIYGTNDAEVGTHYAKFELVTGSDEVYSEIVTISVIE